MIFVSNNGVETAADNLRLGHSSKKWSWCAFIRNSLTPKFKQDGDTGRLYNGWYIECLWQLTWWCLIVLYLLLIRVSMNLFFPGQSRWDCFGSRALQVGLDLHRPREQRGRSSQTFQEHRHALLVGTGLALHFYCTKYIEFLSLIVRPVKSLQMYIKVAQNDFTRKIKDFDTFTKIA